METVGIRSVDVTRGTRSSIGATQWFSRSDDQKFLTLADLVTAKRAMTEGGRTRVVDSRDLRVTADIDNPDDLGIEADEFGSAGLSNWSFGQVCSLAKAPAGYLARLPGMLAATNLNFGLQTLRSEPIKLYGGADRVWAATGPAYGRIYDVDAVEALKSFVERDTGSTWKVPGVMDWRTGRYDPNVPVTLTTTTIYGSDRDVWIFLCDDTHPIEIGKLANGDPDLVFRGFAFMNSETGAAAFKILGFYMRAVCANRNFWGVEGTREIRIRHSSGAPSRFLAEAIPTLEQFSRQSPDMLIRGVQAAKHTLLADNTPEKQADVLTSRGFSASVARSIIKTHVDEEGREPTSAWDFAQAITAKARSIRFTDDRFAMESVASKILDKVTHTASV